MGRQHQVRRQKSRAEQIAFLKAHGETDESIAALLAHSQADQIQAEGSAKHKIGVAHRRWLHNQRRLCCRSASRRSSICRRMRATF